MKLPHLSSCLAVAFLVGCGGMVPPPTVPDASFFPSGGGGGSVVSTGGGGGTTPRDAGQASDGGGATGGDGGMQTTPVALGAPQHFVPVGRVVLVDSADPQASACPGVGGFTAQQRRVEIDLTQCVGLHTDAVGFVGSLTVETAAQDTFDVRLEPSDAAVRSAPHVIGPLQTNGHGVLVQFGAQRTLVLEASGTAPARVRIDVSAFLVPAARGGDFVHLLERPVRWLATNPNDDGFKTVWSNLSDVIREPVLGADDGATAMLGTVHLGPGVWRDERITFHMGPANVMASSNELPRWSSVPVDGHFPWRYSSFFLAKAGDQQQVELRASSASGLDDTGPEPWVDAVGYLAPHAGLELRPLSRPLVAPPQVHANDQLATFSTGLTGIAGVTGTLTFDLPNWPFDERNRWFFVHVAKDEAQFPGALGGGLEGADWMTAGLNQNGRVTVRFTTRVTPAGQFVMRHFSYVAGGSSVAPSYHQVTVNLRVDGVLAEP